MFFNKLMNGFFALLLLQPSRDVETQQNSTESMRQKGSLLVSCCPNHLVMKWTLIKHTHTHVSCCRRLPKPKTVAKKTNKPVINKFYSLQLFINLLTITNSNFINPLQFRFLS